MLRTNFAQGYKNRVLFAIILVIVIKSMPVMGGLELLSKPMAKVTPEVGIIYSVNSQSSIFLPDFDNYNFTYTIQLKDNLSNINLEVYNPKKDIWVLAGISNAKNANDLKALTSSVQSGRNLNVQSNNSTNVQTDCYAKPISKKSTLNGYNEENYELIYNVNLSSIFDTPFLGWSKYRLTRNNDVIGDWEWKGPFIGAIIGNETATRNGDYHYNYSAEFKISKVIMDKLSNKNISVSFYYKNQSDANYSIYKSNYYTSTEEEQQKLEWINAPPFYRVEFIVNLAEANEI
jgi:hypothetical protein